MPRMLETNCALQKRGLVDSVGLYRDGSIIDLTSPITIRGVYVPMRRRVASMTVASLRCR